MSDLKIYSLYADTGYVTKAQLETDIDLILNVFCINQQKNEGVCFK